MSDSPLLKKFFLFTSFGLLSALPVRAAPITDLYEITAGTYTQIGSGFGGSTFDLPFSYQTYIELTIDRELETAEMRILTVDFRSFEFPGFEPPYFSNGKLSGNLIFFRDTDLVSVFGDPGELEYDVIVEGDLLGLQGHLISESSVFDFPYAFHNTGVQASIVPEPATAILLALGLVIPVLRSRWKELYSPMRE